MKPLFIVFDGIDGSGKTTQINLLKEYLEKKGCDIFITSEPSKGENGKKIEDILRRRAASEISKEKWLDLFTLDRKENVREIIGALKEGKTVLCDRYYYSTLAYQLNEEEWQSYVQKFIKPDLIFILDVSSEVGLKRVKEKYEQSGEKRTYFEKQKILKDVRKKFLLLPNYLNENIKIIEGNRKIQDIFEDIRKEIDLKLRSDK
jgi:dTMP kinase